MKRKILMILLVLLLLCSLFPFTMFIHGSQIEDSIDYVSKEEYIEVSNQGYQDPLLDTSISFVQANNYEPYFITTDVGKQFYNGYDQQMYGDHVKKVVDISEHNGVIDFEGLKASGVDGVIIRAGWGAGGVDVYFDRNIKECNRLNIPYGLYLYSYAYDANFAYREASDLIYLLNQYDLSNLRFPIYYDLEDFTPWYDGSTYRYPPKDPSIYNSIVKTFVQAFEDANYHDVVHVYSYRSKLYSSLNSSYIHALTSWVAEYNPSLNFVNHYYQGTSGWQYTSSGTIAGINTRVDLNAFSDYFFANHHCYFTKETMVLNAANKASLQYVTSSNNVIFFESSNPQICSVDGQGNIYAKKQGKAIITIKDEHIDCYDTIEIEVLPPKSPTNLKLRQSDKNEVVLTWEPVKNAIGYEIYAKHNQEDYYLMDIITTDMQQYYIGYLEDDSKISIKMKTITQYDKSDDSFVVSKQLGLAPSRNVIAKQINPTTIQLSYSKVDEALAYDIYRATSVDGKYYKLIRTKQCTYIDENRVPYQAYYYKVRSVNDNERSDLTLPISMQTKLTPPSFQLHLHQKKVNIQLEKVNGATYYQIYYRAEGNQSFHRLITLNQKKLSYIHKKVSNKRYEYKVRCYRVIHGQKVYSRFSDIKAIKVS